MSATEEYRAQAEARNRLEDTWKAGQEAAMFRWRAEQHAMQQVRGQSSGFRLRSSKQCSGCGGHRRCACSAGSLQSLRQLHAAAPPGANSATAPGGTTGAGQLVQVVQPGMSDDEGSSSSARILLWLLARLISSYLVWLLQGEVAWKSMNDARFGDLVRQYAARNNAEDAWKAQSEARLKAGEDFQVRPPSPGSFVC
jgi:hypothetical protein